MQQALLFSAKLRFTASFLALAAVAGCQRPTSPPSVAAQPTAAQIEPAKAVSPPAVTATTPLAGPPIAAGPQLPPVTPEESAGQTLVEETWDAYFIQGARVGYAHTTIANVDEGGRKLVRTRNVSRTTLKRAGQTIEQDLTLTSWESPAGELVRFESQMTTGPGEIVSRGRASAGTLAIDTTTLGKTQSQTRSWPAGTGGFFAAEQSLRKQPLQPGEKRTVTGLLPIFNVAGKTELSALEHETVKLPGGEAKLLRISSIIDLGQQKLETILWVDEAGVVHKSLVPAIGQEAVRTTKADALQKIEGREFDLLAASVVKLQGDLPEPLKTTQVVYRARVKDGKIAGVFAEGPTQSVKPIDERTADVTVRAGRLDKTRGPQIETASKPTDDDLAANNLIQADDPLVVQMAGTAAPQSDEPREVARALEKYVAATIQKKNFSQAFATAGEVARTLEGDCTEHAVLLAALCRARRIPCRVAIGLVHYPPQQGFAYHMWNEAWIDGRWVPLDGTLGHGGVAADRLKIAETNLSGAGGLTAMLPVVQVFGRLELEVVSAE
jgi:hypothetical protein